MNNWQSGCLLAVILPCFVNFPRVQAEEIKGAESNLGQGQQSKLTKDEYMTDVMSLATWKSKVQGTSTGDRLLGMLTSLDAALVRNPRDTGSLFNRAYLLGTVGCTKSAVLDLSRAIESDPNAGNLFCERGICYMDLQEYEKASSDLNQAVHLNPSSGDARLARGRLRLLQNLPGLALPDLLKCRNENLDWAPVLPGELPSNFYRAPDYYLGLCYELLGNHEEAINYFNDASKDVTGAGGGFIHRYADQPGDAAERIGRLQNGNAATTNSSTTNSL